MNVRTFNFSACYLTVWWLGTGVDVKESIGGINNDGKKWKEKEEKKS